MEKTNLIHRYNRRAEGPVSAGGPYGLQLILPGGVLSEDRPTVAVDGGHYRIHDGQDNAVLFCYTLANAVRAVDALNYLWQSETADDVPYLLTTFNRYKP